MQFVDAMLVLLLITFIFRLKKLLLLLKRQLESAVANLMQNENSKDIDPDVLKIKEAYVNQGPVMKRFRAASMGRASRLRRPSSHLTIVLTTE